MTGHPEKSSNTFSRVIFYLKNVTLLDREVVAKRENGISVLLRLHKFDQKFDQG